MLNSQTVLRLLPAALLILSAISFAFAAENQKLPFSGEWVGDATWRDIKNRTGEEPLEVVFHVTGNPATLKNISFTRGGFKGTTQHFEINDTKIKFWVGPKDEQGRGKQVCDLEFKDGVLRGTLIGPTPAGTQLKREIVLRPK